MKKVYTDIDNGATLFCTDLFKYENLKEFDPINTNYLLCAKSPFHKLAVGYAKSCPQDNPEYLYAYRENGDMLILNMVDANQKKYFADEMIDEGIDFIEKSLKNGIDVVVVCNKGESRSPSMCLMYLIKNGYFYTKQSIDEVIKQFKEIYPAYNPNIGIYEYVCDYWSKALHLTKE